MTARTPLHSHRVERENWRQAVRGARWLRNQLRLGQTPRPPFHIARAINLFNELPAAAKREIMQIVPAGPKTPARQGGTAWGPPPPPRAPPPPPPPPTPPRSNQPMAKNMAKDDAAPKSHNEQAMIDKILDVDRRLAPLEAQRQEIGATIREIRRELKDYEIDATYFNWARSVYQMEDIDARDHAIDNIRICAQAFKLGGQAGLFVDDAEADAAKDGQDVEATLDAIEAKGKDAGLEGKTLADVNTYTPGSAAAARFETGWKAGQKVLLNKLGKKGEGEAVAAAG